MRPIKTLVQYYTLDPRLLDLMEKFRGMVNRSIAIGSSSCCSVCGDRLVFSKQSRTVYCPTCSIHIDRDVNAARNILNAGLRFSLLGLSAEAVKGNPSTMVILGVDGSQPSPTFLNSEQPKT